MKKKNEAFQAHAVALFWTYYCLFSGVDLVLSCQLVFCRKKGDAGGAVHPLLSSTSSSSLSSLPPSISTTGLWREASSRIVLLCSFLLQLSVPASSPIDRLHSRIINQLLLSGLYKQPREICVISRGCNSTTYAAEDEKNI